MNERRGMSGIGLAHWVELLYATPSGRFRHVDAIFRVDRERMREAELAGHGSPSTEPPTSRPVLRSTMRTLPLPRSIRTCASEPRPARSLYPWPADRRLLIWWIDADGVFQLTRLVRHVDSRVLAIAGVDQAVVADENTVRMSLLRKC